MITPIELQSKTFKTGIGFEKKDVENFLNNLLVDYESLYKDNMELNDKINVLNEGINYYKSIEKTLQKALLLAEKTAEETKDAARKQARAIEEEAKVKAQLILLDANKELGQMQQRLIQLATQYEAYKAQFRHLAEAQCDFLDSEPFQLHITDFTVMREEEFDISQEENSQRENFQEEKPTKNIHPKNISQEAVSQARGFDSEEKKEKPGSSQEDFEFYNLNEDDE